MSISVMFLLLLLGYVHDDESVWNQESDIGQLLTVADLITVYIG